VPTAPDAQWFADRLTGETRGWYEKALAAAREGGVASDGFAIAWSGCARRLGKARLEADTGADPLLRTGDWCMDEAGRALLLLTAAHSAGASPGQVAEAVADLFARGELREQQALLRTLAHLPDPERYVPLAAEAVRSNALTVLEALACDNPFPARHMPDLAFNQMIMKAIFNGLSLRRVVALAERTNAELQRMVAAYASERRAAGRVVPADVDLILGGTPNASV
jgi:hypothetical protein